MRRLTLALLTVPLLLGSAVAGCGGPEPAAEPQLRTVPASSLRLVGEPGPDDRRLTVRYVAGALLWDPAPVARVEVDQNQERVIIRVYLTERVPAADEPVPNLASVRTATVDLDRPLGRASVLDGSATPPAPMPHEAQ